MAQAINSRKWVEEHRNLFASVVGHTVRIKINNVLFTTDAKLQTIQPTVLGEIENPPEKRMGKDEKQYTPPCFSLLFDQGKLVFAIEDTVIRETLQGGIKVCAGDNCVELEVADADH